MKKKEMQEQGNPTEEERKKELGRLLNYATKEELVTMISLAKSILAQDL